MKKAAALALAMVMALSLATMALAADFEDMPTDWSADAVQSAVANGLLSGKDGKIAASDNLTRAEMATIITRAFGAEVKDNISFTDVASDAWYVDYVAQAAHMGVMNGSNGKFNPAANITRQEVFTVLARALKLADGSAEDLAAFSDADKVSSWAVPTVSALVKAGYVSGSNGALNPTANITRAEFAQVMYNIFNNAYLNQAATYEEVDGKNVIISSANVTVKGVEIEGDVVIADGVGDGDVFLEDVTVGGRVVVRGGGMNSVHFRGSKAGSVIVTKVDGNVRVVFDEESTVETVSVEGGKASTDVRIEGAVKNVVVNDATSTVVLADAKVEKLDVAAANAKISLAGATTVAEMTVAEGATNTTMAAEKTAEVTKLTTAEDVFIDNEDVIKESNDEEKINPERPAESGDPAESTAPDTGDGNVEPDNNQQGETPVPTPDPEATPRPTKPDANPVDPSDKADGAVSNSGTAAAECSGGHQWVADGESGDGWTVTEAASCTEKGTAERTCKRTGCTYKETKELGMVDHTKGAQDGYLAATCTAAGWRTFKCSVCDQEAAFSEDVPQLSHGYSSGWVMTDTQHYHQCPTCGTVVTKNAETGAITGGGEAEAHTWKKTTVGEVEKDAASTGTANHKYECTICGYTKTVAHRGTNFTDNWATGETGHWHECADCNYKSVVTKHTFSAETGKCTVCEYPCGHTGHWDAATGTCKVCGKVCNHPNVNESTHVCGTCGMTVTPHTHQYATKGSYTYDADSNSCSSTCTAAGCTTPAAKDTHEHIPGASQTTCEWCGTTIPAHTHQWASNDHDGWVANADGTTHTRTCTAEHCTLTENKETGNCNNTADAACTSCGRAATG